MGHPILMGRKTFESIGRLLPGRTTIILSRTSDYHFPGAMVVNSWERALEIAAQVDTNPTKECFVIGGGDIYAIALPHASRIYYSQVEADIDGDTFFPSLNESEWTTIDRVDYQADAANEFAFSLRTLQRTSADASDHGSVPP